MMLVDEVFTDAIDGEDLEELQIVDGDSDEEEQTAEDLALDALDALDAVSTDEDVEDVERVDSTRSQRRRKPVGRIAASQHRSARPIAPSIDGPRCPHSTVAIDPRACSQCAGIKLGAERRYRRPAAAPPIKAWQEAKFRATSSAGGKAAKARRTENRRAKAQARPTSTPIPIPANTTTIASIAERLHVSRQAVFVGLRKAGIKPISTAQSAGLAGLYEQAAIEQWIAKRRPRRWRFVPEGATP